MGSAEGFLPKEIIILGEIKNKLFSMSFGEVSQDRYLPSGKEKREE